MKFDSNYVYEITRSLSYPRMVGSDGEKKARDDIEKWMKEIGLETFREDFSASDFPMGVLARWVMLVISIPLLLGAVSYRAGAPCLAFMFELATIFSIWKTAKIANNFKDFLKYGKQVPTQNITGKFVPAQDKAHVVLMAHFDTKSQPFPIELRILAYLLSAFAIAIALIVLLAASVGTLLRVWEPSGNFALIFSLLAVVFSASLVFNKVENKSVGSLDNAAGVGVIMGIAKAWMENPFDDIGLTVVATSAEEWGLQGAERWVEKHACEYPKDKTIFLNYDGPGAKGGRIIITSRFGLPPREIAGNTLKQDFESACRELSIRNARDVYIPFGASTDMMPVSERGFRVLNIGSLSRGVHTLKDNMENIDAMELKKAGDIGLKVIQKFRNRIIKI